ncbi:MAG TPA: histidine kinase dimerization/phospho-acceptor domain-containing protein, partial [Puia sp.]
MRTKRYTRKIRESAILMIIAIIGIAAFQCYWFKNLYNEEWRTLKRETDLSFKNVLFKLQVDRLKKEVQFSKQVDTVFRVSGMPAIVNATAQQRIAISFRTTFSNDTIVQLPPVISRDNAPKKFAITDAFFNFSSDSTMPAVMEYHSDSTKFPSVDSLSIEFRKELAKNKIVMPVSAQRRVIPEPDLKHPRASEGFTKILYIFNPSISYSYEFRMSNQAPYILGRLKWQLLMGILLVAFTTLSFIFLYRNLRKQDQLAAIKNEFISNMTHELKTPISTVKVAVEALRHFDALDDPKRTREYLDIS